jgi:hypothetical protein
MSDVATGAGDRGWRPLAIPSAGEVTKKKPGESEGTSEQPPPFNKEKIGGARDFLRNDPEIAQAQEEVAEKDTRSDEFP